MSAKHTTSDQNSTHVTGADQYRLSFSLCLTPDHPDFAAMEEFLLPAHRRPEGYGLGLLESEEYSVTYVGTVHQIQEFHNTGGASLDISQGHFYEFWPQGKEWDELIPPNTWNPGGQGIVTEFDHRGTKVVVYEYLADREGEQIPMVAFHCLCCHSDHRIHYDQARENHGPRDRRSIGRKARVHIRHANDDCRPLDPRILEAVTAVANKTHGLNNPVTTNESHCATTGPCSQIRHLRASATAERGSAHA